MYTLFLVSFSLFQAAILHHVVLFFFYQIIPGLLSASMRILKGTLLRVIFFSRIDRTSLVQGFQKVRSTQPVQAIYKWQRLCEVRSTTYRPVMLPCCSLFPKTALNQWINVCKTSATSRHSSVTRSKKLPRT